MDCVIEILVVSSERGTMLTSCQDGGGAIKRRVDQRSISDSVRSYSAFLLAGIRHHRSFQKPSMGVQDVKSRGTYTSTLSVDR